MARQRLTNTLQNPLRFTRTGIETTLGQASSTGHNISNAQAWNTDLEQRRHSYSALHSLYSSPATRIPPSFETWKQKSTGQDTDDPRTLQIAHEPFSVVRVLIGALLQLLLLFEFDTDFKLLPDLLHSDCTFGGMPPNSARGVRSSCNSETSLRGFVQPLNLPDAGLHG